MAFALIIVGITLLVSSVRNTQGDLFTLVKGDFSGPNNFVYWFLSILVIGAIGYIPKLKPFSVAFMTLVIIVLFVAKPKPGQPATGGFFDKLMAGLQTTQSGNTPQASTTGSPIPQLPSFPNLSGF